MSNAEIDNNMTSEAKKKKGFQKTISNGDFTVKLADTIYEINKTLEFDTVNNFWRINRKKIGKSWRKADDILYKVAKKLLADGANSLRVQTLAKECLYQLSKSTVFSAVKQQYNEKKPGCKSSEKKDGVEKNSRKSKKKMVVNKSIPPIPLKPLQAHNELNGSPVF